MMSAVCRPAAVAALVVLGASRGWAQAIAPAADDHFQLGGSVRTLGAAVQPAAESAAATTGGYNQSLLRLTASAQPTSRISVEVHLVQSYTYASAAAGLAFGTSAGFGLATGETRYRALDATADWIQHPDQAASLWIDRFNVKIALPRADITVGRQAVSFGKAYFWNPLDEFLPFDARQVDRDYKAGVDAVRLDIPRGQFSGVNLVAVFGRELTPSGLSGDAGTPGVSWYGSAALARYFTTVRGWDIAAQAGKVYGAYETGAGIVGEVRRLEVRGEAAYMWAMPNMPLPPPLSGRLIENHLAAVAGVGKRFPNTLWIELEHFHNGAGKGPEGLNTALVRFATGAALNLSREITGVTASFDFLPIVTGQIAALHSWSDGSSQIQPTVTWSVSDNSDLLAGVSLGAGPEPAPGTPLPQIKSEFGSFPKAYFAEFKWYF